MTIDVLTYISFSSKLTEPFDRFLLLIESLDRQAKSINKVHILCNGVNEYGPRPNDIQLHLSRKMLDKTKLYVSQDNIKNIGCANYLFNVDSDATHFLFIQPSVVINCDFISKLEGRDVEVGSIISERNHKVWCNGHYFENGNCLNKNFLDKNNHDGEVFPCFSCFSINKKISDAIIKTNGYIANPCMNHYGDCIDLGMSLMKLGKKTYYNEKAICTKRWPEINRFLLPSLKENMKSLYTSGELELMERYYS